MRTRQLGLNLSPFLVVQQDVQRYSSLYSTLGASTFLDAIGPFGVQLTAALAGSDWPGQRGARSFGYHGATYQVSVLRGVTVAEGRNAEIMVTGTLDVPAFDIGPTLGTWGVRFKLLGPLFN